MFFVDQIGFLVLSFFMILIMIYLFNSLIQSAIFEAYRVIQLTDNFNSESAEIKEKINKFLRGIITKIKSIFKRKQT